MTKLLGHADPYAQQGHGCVACVLGGECSFVIRDNTDTGITPVDRIGGRLRKIGGLRVACRLGTLGHGDREVSRGVDGGRW